MITLSTYFIYEYMKEKFPSLAPYLKNGFIDKSAKQSVGVFLGPDTRSERVLSIGGIDCTTTRMIPINILVRWTENQKVCDEQAIEIYNALLLEKQNFNIVNDEVKIACINLLDSTPVSLGRDDKNICEAMIRANFYYYV